MLTKYFSTILSLLAAGGAIASGPDNGAPRSLEDDITAMSMPTSPTPNDLNSIVSGLVQAGLDITPSVAEDVMKRIDMDGVNAEGLLGFGRSRTYCNDRYPCRNACRNCQWLLYAFEEVKGGAFDEDDLLRCNPLLELFCATQSIVLPSKYDVPMENLEAKGYYLQDVFPEGHPKHELGEKLDYFTCEYFGYWCFRRLQRGERHLQEDITRDERVQIIKKMEDHGAHADASFTEKQNLISKDACDALVKLLDISFEAHISSGEDIPVGKLKANGVDENEVWTNHPHLGIFIDFSRKINADELVALIGKEEAQKIVDFFHDSLEGLTIDHMYLHRHQGGSTDEELYENPWHVDDYAAMEIVLNDNFDGGATLHLNEEGVHKSEPHQGSALAHFDNIVHGTQPSMNGAKYKLVLKNYYGRHQNEGVVKLSKEIVDALPVRI